jgi:broad specificity phosphatase PhoE
MARLTLVRHGRASGGWDDDLDPGLDTIGQRQAMALVDLLAGNHPQPIVSSPMRRARETAAPLAARWGVEPAIEPAVTEIPSPPGVPLGERVAWLRRAMAGGWSDLGPAYQGWRDQVLGCLTSFAADTIVVSHFIVINLAIGACLSDDRVVIRSVDNCSRTVVEVFDGRLVLVEGGHEADTLIR